MKNILVTGANGQLGNEIRRISGNAENSGFNFLFTDVDSLDITGKSSLVNYFSKYSVDLIINCAAYTAVDKAEQDEQNAEKLNSEAVALLAEIAGLRNIQIIHISTDYVFEGTAYMPYKETDRANPMSAYGRTKYHGELELAKSGAEYAIVRTSWLYSGYGHNFVKTMLRLAGEKEEIKVVFDQIGSPTFAGDLANAVLAMVRKCLSGNVFLNREIYHYSNDGVCSWFDLAIHIMKIAGSGCRIIPIESKDYPQIAHRPFYSVLNNSKIKSAFDINIPYWQDSLEFCIKNYLLP